MLHFLTTDQLYNPEKFTDEYLEAFNSLYPAAKKILLERNKDLQNYIEGKQKTDSLNEVYDKYDYSKQRIEVGTVYVISYKGDDEFCPHHTVKLRKMQVVVKNDGKMKSIHISACRICKRLYTADAKMLKEKLERLEMPYMIVNEVKADEE